MTRYKQSFYTTTDKKKLFVQEWIPEKDPKSLILYVHGLGEHAGRMDHWAERFVNKQVGFIAYDQRGHGKSDGKRGHPTNVNYLLDDVKSIVALIRNDYPDIPVILYGHSMGGSIAINYVISTTFTVDALIATSPWLKLATPPSPALMKIVKPLSKIAPGICISNGLDAKDISRDEREVIKYSEDPLVHPKISIGLANSLFEAGLNALRNVYKINCPFLLMHGTGDKITSAKASEEYVMNTSDRTTLKLWDDAYHELHHEPIREDVFEFIIDWLKQYKFL
ncbi:MAG: lysophospholipase [Bacteroidales bacterium]|jgi:alpha-beta hydrolase superfamily lysophospholipase|nr:lysophospholipase [Bacteroidales bacterium]